MEVEQKWAAQERWPVWLLAVLASCLFLVGLDNPLLEPEEARYAEIPRQMLAEDQFLTPVLHGQPYLQKPPLLYWLVMACYRLFGVHDWACRLVPAAAGVLLVFTTFFWARRLIHVRGALMAGLVLCLAPRFVYQTRMLTLDGLLALSVVAGWALMQTAWQKSTFDWRCWLAAGLCCGLGILTKGPVALVLVLTPLVLLGLCERRLPVPWLAWPVFLAVSLGIALPWFGYLAMAHADAARDFFWLHNLGRFVDPIDHEEPWWFFLPYLFLGALPWTLWLIPCIKASRERQRPEAQYPLRFPWLCFGFTLLFFSLSGCKRPGYILPAFPPLAVVLGAYLERRVLSTPGNGRRLAWLSAACFAGILAAFVFVLPGYHEKFGLRSQIIAQRELVDKQHLQIACFPRMWDSVPFYLQRKDVVVFSANQDRLATFLQKQPTLVFVKKNGFVADFVNSLPENLAFRPLGEAGANVMTGLVYPRAAPSTIEVGSPSSR